MSRVLKFFLISSFAFMTSNVVLGQVCSEDNCDTVTKDTLGEFLSEWQIGSVRNCNGDRSQNILDIVCVLSIIPDFDPPKFDVTDDQFVSRNNQLTFSLNALDPNGDQLVYFVDSLPENAYLDAQTGEFSFLPDDVQSGRFELEFSVSDGWLKDHQKVVVEIKEGPTTVQSSSPIQGEGEVALTRETILKFNYPIDPATLNEDSVFASFGGHKIPSTRHLSPDQREVRLFYPDYLPPSARVRVTVDGSILQDHEGMGVDGNGDGTADGSLLLDFETLSVTPFPGTRVCGRVFASELQDSRRGKVNLPLAGVFISVDGDESLFTMTDDKGHFCLESAPVGRFFVHIDGSQAGSADLPEGAYYPNVGKAWEGVPGVEVNVGDIFLPLIPPETLQLVSEEEETAITFAPSVLSQNPSFAGVGLTMPPGNVFFDSGEPGEMVGIAPVAPDRLPGELPEGLDFPLVITVQTDGATNFDRPVPICFPNLPDPNTGVVREPGTKTAL